MSQTIQPELDVAAAKPRARKDWELFWRIVAGLMLVVIAWVIWVLYQITPRSVVTPLAYEPRTKSIGAPSAAAGASAADASLPPAASTVQPGLPVQSALQRAVEPTAAELAMGQAQAAARAGAHQSSADVQAASEMAQDKPPEKEQPMRQRLKLSTEIGTPLAENKKMSAVLEGKARATPADSAGKARP